MADGLGAGESIVSTRWGRMAVFDNDTGVSEALRHFGEYDTDEVAIYHKLLGSDRTFVDIGCNIGAISRPIAGLDPSRRVVAVEPQDTFARLARLNLAPFPKASIHELIVTDRPCQVDVPVIRLDRQGNFGAVPVELADRAGRNRTVPAVTLDEFLDEAGLIPDLVKIDTEGMEPQVLQGGRKTLATARPILSVEVDRRDSGAASIAFLLDGGYRPFLAFFRMISRSNPRFSPDIAICRHLHVHVIAFAPASEIPDWFLSLLGPNELKSPDAYLERMARRFP